MTDFSDRLKNLSPEKRRSALDTLPGDLVNTAQTARLHQLLTDFDFIQAKLAEFGVQALIEDYNLAMKSDVLLNLEQTETLELIAGALRRSAHVLEEDTTQLAGQLWGRLLSFDRPEIVALLEQTKQKQEKPWFRPLTANLTPPGGPLISTFSGHSRWVNAVAIAPDGQQAVSASWDNTLKLWDLATGSELATFRGHSWWVNAVAITPDGQQAVFASLDNALKLWDLATGSELATFRGHRGWVNAVAITHDGQKAVSASWDNTLKLWDLATGSALANFWGHRDWVNAVAITPDGKQAVSASRDKTLKLWDLTTRWQLATFGGHSGPVLAVAITPDGKQAVSASEDRTLKLWDLTTGSQLATFRGHSDSVYAVAISPLGIASLTAPDGKQAVSASRDNTLKLWDLATGKELATFTGEAAMVSCAVAPDGVTVVAGDSSGVVHFLRLEGLRGQETGFLSEIWVRRQRLWQKPGF